MFVEWKKRRLGPKNDRSDPECVHNGHGRWLWTAHVMEPYAAPSGPRNRTILWPAPDLRSCCMADPVVRVRWWNATADALLAAKGIEDAVWSELAKRVPLPTEEEEAIFMKWPREPPWRDQRRVDRAAAHRARVLREVRRVVAAQARPAEKDWEDAVGAWQKADDEYALHRWEEYAHHEREGIDCAGKAIAKARERQRLAAADEDVAAWLDAVHEHVRRLDERRTRHEEEQRRWRAEVGRRTHRATDDERHRQAAAEVRRGTSSAAPSVIDRMRNGSLKDWADLLGVTPFCSRDELRRAHRDAIRRHHPDRGGDDEMMKAVNIAKELLDAELAFAWAVAGSN